MTLSPINSTSAIIVAACAFRPGEGFDGQYPPGEIVPGGVVPPNTVTLAAPSLVPKQLLLYSLIVKVVFKGLYRLTELE